MSLWLEKFGVWAKCWLKKLSVWARLGGFLSDRRPVLVRAEQPAVPCGDGHCVGTSGTEAKHALDNKIPETDYSKCLALRDLPFAQKVE